MSRAAHAAAISISLVSVNVLAAWLFDLDLRALNIASLPIAAYLGYRGPRRPPSKVS